MPNICLVLEYDGKRFHGWQQQIPGVRSIQEELHRALETVLRTEIRTIYAAGRTDSGVHALGQVVNFTVPESPDLGRLRRAISGMFRAEISVRAAYEIDENFNARRDALSKQYSYLVCLRDVPPALQHGRAWHVARRLDLDRMRREAQSLIGEYDFTSLQAGDCSAGSPVRKIFESELTQQGDYLLYRVVGNGFLKQMVRTIVGTLVGIAGGRIAMGMEEILVRRDRRCAGPVAPAYGLTMDWVSYSPTLEQRALRRDP